MALKNRKGPLFIIAASILWSFGGLCIKLIPWGALSIVGLRSALAALVFAVYRKSFRVKLNVGTILAAVCLSLTIMLYVYANKYTTAAAAILLQFSSPVFIILLNLLFYRTKPRRSEAVAVIATILGMTLFFADKLEPGGMLGNVMAVGSGLTFAGVFICNRREDVVPEQAMFLGFLINAVIGLPSAFTQVTADPVAWGAVLFMGIVQVGLAYVFFSVGIKTTPALLACLITAFEPILNPVWVALATNEVPGPPAIAGGVVIVATVLAYNIHVDRAEKKASAQGEPVPKLQ
jgi:drug/metabolite transporter (DMT)-like permease